MNFTGWKLYCFHTQDRVANMDKQNKQLQFTIPRRKQSTLNRTYSSNSMGNSQKPVNIFVTRHVISPVIMDVKLTYKRDKI